MKEPKYELWKSIDDGLYYFHLKAANGKVVLASEGYNNKKDAIDTIKLIQKSGTAIIKQ